MFVGAEACDYSPICAKDLRSGGPQNFDSECHMNEENNRGGSKSFDSKFVWFFHSKLFFLEYVKQHNGHC